MHRVGEDEEEEDDELKQHLGYQTLTLTLPLTHTCPGCTGEGPDLQTCMAAEVGTC